MTRSLPFRWFPLLVVALSACSDTGPVAPDPAFDLSDGEPLAAVLPDLAPEPGTAGTDRYVPTLERVFRRSVRVIREKKRDDAAQAVTARARELHGQVGVAREAGDQAALAAAVRELKAYSAGVGLRVFGPGLARHVAGAAGARIRDVSAALRALHEAGEDVDRLVAATSTARRHLTAAHEAWEAERRVAALVHAAAALDIAVRVAAAL